MLLSHIFEAPIGIDTHFVNNSVSSFRSDDKQLRANPKAHNKVEKIWSSSVCDVKLTLVDVGVNPETAIDNALFADGDQENKISHEEIKQMVTVDPNAINVVFTQNEGARRMPLTGWIIAHRIWHAIEIDRTNPSQDKIEHNTLNQLIYDVLNYFSMDLEPIDVSHALGTSKAARDKNLTVHGELIAELFAQYILTGKARVNRLGTVLEKNGKRMRTTVSNLAWINQNIKGFEDRINELFAIRIKNATGKLFIL